MILAAATATAALPFGLADPAAGYVLFGGCNHFDPANDNDGLGIGANPINFNQSRWSSTEDAAGRWNAAISNGQRFTIVSYGSSTRDVRVEWVTLGAAGPVAQTNLTCNPSSGHYSQDPIFLWNLDVTQPSPTGTRQTVTGIHEFGHTFGMDHNQTGGCDSKTAGLMHQPSSSKWDNCSWYNPSIDDVEGQEAADLG